MPMYDVICPKCKKVKEIFCRYEDRNQEVCEECNEPMTVKPTNCGVFFKGSGWYCTDYGNKALPKNYSFDDAKPNIVKPGDYG